MYPQTRLRRLRSSSLIRDMVRETCLSVNDLVAPLFVVPGGGISNPISSLPGQKQLSTDLLVEECFQLKKLGISSVILFGLPEAKDEIGSAASADDGVIQQAIVAIKNDIPDLTVIADLCFCEYTSHGHCGVIVDADVDNDQTLVHLEKQAVSLVRSGADIIAPSGMMDGAVEAIRRALDEEGFQNALIMSYAVKYASAFYGPFRDAVESSPSFGDRRSYQMDPANAREALREAEQDVLEGADILMVKPALAYLDIIKSIRESFDLPLAAYSVSGEYAMIKAASERGMIDGQQVMYESLLSIKRAGADILITYFAKELAERL